MQAKKSVNDKKIKIWVLTEVEEDWNVSPEGMYGWQWVKNGKVAIGLAPEWAGRVIESEVMTESRWLRVKVRCGGGWR